MVERTVYVGATVQVILRLATGETVQASIPNMGDATAHAQGTPLAVQVPPDALRVLAGGPAGVVGSGVPADPEPAPAVAG